MGIRLKLPPDDVSDWPTVTVDMFKTRDWQSVSSINRIHDWLALHTEGDYYVGTSGRYTRISFQIQSDALLYAMTWF
jgi:hypothetical protein